MRYLIIITLLFGTSLLFCQEDKVESKPIPKSEFEIQSEIEAIEEKKIPKLEFQIQDLKNRRVDFESEKSTASTLEFPSELNVELTSAFEANNAAQYSSLLGRINGLFQDLFVHNEDKYYYELGEFTELRSIENQISQIEREFFTRLDYYTITEALRNNPDLSSLSFNHNSFSRKYNKVNFDKAKERLKTKRDEWINLCIKILDEKEKELKQLNERLIKLQEAIQKEKKSINLVAIQLGLPLFCLTIILLFLGPLIIRSLSKNADNFQARNSSVLLELITVFLLTMTILILGLGNILESEVLGTLIGGISGYVLNKITSTNLVNQSQNQQNQNPS